MKTSLPLLLIAMTGCLSHPPASAGADVLTTNAAPASQAVNALGIDLLRKATPAGANALLSPYSIQTALAMTYAGADGTTRGEMQKVLSYPADDAELHGSFAGLQKTLEALVVRSAERVEKLKQRGGKGEPVSLTVANRLFGQQGYAFREPFLALLNDTYAAPFQPMDFVKNAAGATREINLWVDEKTRQRIRDLIPPDALDRETRLVLVNAIHFKAPWSEPFPESSTKPEPFHLAGGAKVDVPTMVHKARLGHARRDGFTVVTIPYGDGDLQFLILLPDAITGLEALEPRLTPDLLASCGNPARTEVILHLPKLKLEPPVIRLGQALQDLGMTSAFDKPRGSANFDRMAPRKPDDYLRISEVFHKTFLALDEKGTEAAAATAVVMMRVTSVTPTQPPVEVRVDHPFIFAIQHRASGTCLFLGRIHDPR